MEDAGFAALFSSCFLLLYQQVGPRINHALAQVDCPRAIRTKT